jgi:hypothetical protein
MWLNPTPPEVEDSEENPVVRPQPPKRYKISHLPCAEHPKTPTYQQLTELDQESPVNKQHQMPQENTASPLPKTQIAFRKPP